MWAMRKDLRENYLRGLRGGLPIGIGYFAVSFTLGIVMRNAGLTAWEGTLMSLVNNTSAGEAAGTAIIQNDGSYFEMALSQLVINLRYLLMSAALILHVDRNLSVKHRMLMSLDITDEVFALSVLQPKPLSPFFSYGVMCSTIPFWAAGTALGIVFGNILSADIVRALSIALYAMFVAVVIPPCRKNVKLLAVVASSMILSFIASRAPYISSLSEGNRIIILTVVLGTVFALLFPPKEEEL